MSTHTTTLTESIIYVTETVTSGTTTIPTPNGFTPILSETTSVSLEVDAVGGAVINAQHATTSYPASVICSTTTSITITKTATTGHAATTITSTTTVNVAAATFYAACDSNNIVDQGSGVGSGHAIEFTTVGNGNYTSTIVANSSAYDCCVSCQTTYPCAFSILFTNYGDENPLECALEFEVDGTCDGGISVGPAEYYYDPGDPSSEPGQVLIVSNGACGQIVYGGGFDNGPG
ncbi:hypothetical protein IMSHALPRED_002812 [Imshaugia aleurites]|uniref:Uncharacterized protein n=1 Tax=Imshaugia aleurites TaxID=172621 RepID=A0A8H3J6M6_9LECA|nr:hypothetical protein IMSHALPRED_002812 [Imshaugia aleurites]